MLECDRQNSALPSCASPSRNGERRPGGSKEADSIPHRPTHKAVALEVQSTRLTQLLPRSASKFRSDSRHVGFDACDGPNGCAVFLNCSGSLRSAMSCACSCVKPPRMPQFHSTPHCFSLNRGHTLAQTGAGKFSGTTPWNSGQTGKTTA